MDSSSDPRGASWADSHDDCSSLDSAFSELNEPGAEASAMSWPDQQQRRFSRQRRQRQWRPPQGQNLSACASSPPLRSSLKGGSGSISSTAAAAAAARPASAPLVPAEVRLSVAEQRRATAALMVISPPARGGEGLYRLLHELNVDVDEATCCVLARECGIGEWASTVCVDIEALLDALMALKTLHARAASRAAQERDVLPAALEAAVAAWRDYRSALKSTSKWREGVAREAPSSTTSRVASRRGSAAWSMRRPSAVSNSSSSNKNNNNNMRTASADCPSGAQSGTAVGEGDKAEEEEEEEEEDEQATVVVRARPAPGSGPARAGVENAEGGSSGAGGAVHNPRGVAFTVDAAAAAVDAPAAGKVEAQAPVGGGGAKTVVPERAVGAAQGRIGRLSAALLAAAAGGGVATVTNAEEGDRGGGGGEEEELLVRPQVVNCMLLQHFGLNVMGAEGEMEAMRMRRIGFGDAIATAQFFSLPTARGGERRGTQLHQQQKQRQSGGDGSCSRSPSPLADVPPVVSHASFGRRNAEVEGLLPRAATHIGVSHLYRALWSPEQAGGPPRSVEECGGAGDRGGDGAEGEGLGVGALGASRVRLQLLLGDEPAAFPGSTMPSMSLLRAVSVVSGRGGAGAASVLSGRGSHVRGEHRATGAAAAAAAVDDDARSEAMTLISRAGDRAKSVVSSAYHSRVSGGATSTARIARFEAMRRRLLGRSVLSGGSGSDAATGPGEDPSGHAIAANPSISAATEDDRLAFHHEVANNRRFSKHVSSLTLEKLQQLNSLEEQHVSVSQLAEQILDERLAAERRQQRLRERQRRGAAGHSGAPVTELHRLEAAVGALMDPRARAALGGLALHPHFYTQHGSANIYRAMHRRDAAAAAGGGLRRPASAQACGASTSAATEEAATGSSSNFSAGGATSPPPLTAAAAGGGGGLVVCRRTRAEREEKEEKEEGGSRGETNGDARGEHGQAQAPRCDRQQRCRGGGSSRSSHRRRNSSQRTALSGIDCHTLHQMLAGDPWRRAVSEGVEAPRRSMRLREISELALARVDEATRPKHKYLNQPTRRNALKL